MFFSTKRLHLFFLGKTSHFILITMKTIPKHTHLNIFSTSFMDKTEKWLVFIILYTYSCFVILFSPKSLTTTTTPYLNQVLLEFTCLLPIFDSSYLKTALKHQFKSVFILIYPLIEIARHNIIVIEPLPIAIP